MRQYATDNSSSTLREINARKTRKDVVGLQPEPGFGGCDVIPSDRSSIRQYVAIILAAQCALYSDDLWPEDDESVFEEDPVYDFIIIGAGTAGAVVANRLTEIPDWRVLLIEAGGNPTLGTEIPPLFITNYGTKEDWNFRTAPQKKACLGYTDKKCYWPRGKVLGGTSSINGMYYVRGNKLDYDEWCSYGNTGWCYDEVLPYFKKSENISNENRTEADLRYHGAEGLINVENSREMHPFEDMLLRANEEIGLKIVDDVNGKEQVGVTRVFTTTKNSLRQSTARAFLSPIRDRTNLHVLKNALAHKLMLNGSKVTGVSFLKGPKELTVGVRKEVILSAGAVNTPKILMASGIGPENLLRTLNISVKVNLPVGENLQDHVFAPIFFAKQSRDDSNSLLNIQKMFASYVLRREGPLGTLSPQRVVSFFNTTYKNSSYPDVQNIFVVLAPNQSNLVDIFGEHRFSDEFHEQFEELNKNNVILAVYVTLLQPRSSGRIILRSDKVEDDPIIDAGYFNHDHDMKTLVKAMKEIIKLNNTVTFNKENLKLHWMKLKSCEIFNVNSDEFLECVARELTGTLYHAVGSVKMGPVDDEKSVVNEELKVKNVENLRVVDASVMPKITRGNTMAPVVMIAEKAGDMVKNKWL
ncbi:Glucose dehydrogenase [Eumeta japonica]|uniref:Glucose dehydrogenase n=1 Tax=Eumeta variegata TaxID=151549 RepID=A0A4C1TNZ8_EUMVA|nr:Glucose dehydrogenase [Eumeta japonica]